MPITSSSISSSEAAATFRGPWARFAAVFVGLAAVLLPVVLAVAYVMDPYDTGRPGLVKVSGVRPQGPRTAAASRGRDPGFTGAVFGNSHIQLVSPERLRALTGIPFVQLSTPASGPKEQFVLIDWFLRHHQGSARALVVAVDSLWCTPDPALPNAQPFPFWLFSPDPLVYLGGLFGFDILEELPRRVSYMLGKRAERARPDGYWDYKPNYVRAGYTPEKTRERLKEWYSNMPENPGLRFPAADRLRSLLETLPPDVSATLVFPPVYAGHLPPAGSPHQRVDEACKAAFKGVAEARPGTKVVDWRVDRAETRDPDLFFDHTHYRHPLASLMENDIADAVGRTPPGPAL